MCPDTAQAPRSCYWCRPPTISPGSRGRICNCHASRQAGNRKSMHSGVFKMDAPTVKPQISCPCPFHTEQTRKKRLALKKQQPSFWLIYEIPVSVGNLDTSTKIGFICFEPKGVNVTAIFRGGGRRGLSEFPLSVTLSWNENLGHNHLPSKRVSQKGPV